MTASRLAEARVRCGCLRRQTPSPSRTVRHRRALKLVLRQLKQLEYENGKLKRIVADLSLDKEMLQDAIRRKL
jgi:hypothetical protein